MRQYVGLDVAMDETKVHILDGDGKRVWRGKCRSHPDDIEAVLHQRPAGGTHRPRDRPAYHLAVDRTHGTRPTDGLPGRAPRQARA
jgi:hypothetical protein